MISALFQIFAAVPILTLALVVVTAWALRRRPGRVRHGWVVGFLALLVAADTAEELPLPDPDPEPAEGGSPSPAVPRRHSIELGMGAGQFQTCSGARTYGDVGAMYRYTTPISRETNATAAGGGYLAYQDGGTQVSGGGRASVGLEHRWAGGEVGLMFGALERESALGSVVVPTLEARLGPRDMFFVEAGLFTESPAPLPGPVAHGGVGFAFPALGNSWEPLVVRAGINGLGFYVAPTVPVGGLGNVEISVAYGDVSNWGASALLRLHLAAEE